MDVVRACNWGITAVLYVSLQGTGARREVGVRRVGLRVREKTSFWNAVREWGREAERMKGGGNTASACRVEVPVEG